MALLYEEDEGKKLSRIAPGRRVVPVTPDNDNDNCGKNATLAIRGAGDVAFIPEENSDDEVVIWTMDAGSEINIIVRRVLATGTTASEIYAVS